MKLRLVVTSPGKGEGKVIPITLSQFIIGRDPQCQLRPASPMISKRHCALLVRGGKVFLRDFDSTNGTFINDQPVKGEIEVHHNDLLKAGPLSFRVEMEASVPVNKPTPVPLQVTPAPAAATDDDDSIAAMLLAIQDESSSGASNPVGPDGVPQGSTVRTCNRLFPSKGFPPRAKKGIPTPTKRKIPPKRHRAIPPPPPRPSWRNTRAGSAALDTNAFSANGYRICAFGDPVPVCRWFLTGTAKRVPSLGESRSVEVGKQVVPVEISADLRGWLGRRLLTWFGKHRRPLPWRRDRDPYRIWVSEVMLQQTQVATVVPFFERFVQAFPTLTDLAKADEQDVLRHWQGLGYYRRARDLHRAARQLAATTGGAIPDDPALFGGLPGVGRYILGAVLSQAFGRSLPILEANSLRLLCRFLGLEDDPRSGSSQRWLWEAAERLLPARRVGEFNEALMEVGALVCSPTAPKCPSCPLAQRCVARQLGLQESIPLRPRPAAVVQVQEAAVVVRRGPQVLLVQRPAEGRWGGMWEFPHGPLEGEETHEEAAARFLPQLTGLRVRLGPELLTLKHGVTRFRITLVCFGAAHVGGRFRSKFYQQGEWVDPGCLPSFPVSSPQRRLARSLVESRQNLLF
jgi:A/G-specific adenine glycosylase